MHIRRPNTILTFLTFVTLTMVASCGQNRGRNQANSSTDTLTNRVALKDSVIENGIVTTTISTDIVKLSRLLDLKTYSPTQVKFKYIFLDNAGKNERLSVPGPSDYFLQAVLYFDSLTFEKLLDFDRHADYPSPNYSKGEFKFEWLDKDILAELGNSKDNYRGHRDFFFGTTTGRLWYLDKKVLIINRTD